MLRGLSVDDSPGYEDRLRALCEAINHGRMPNIETLQDVPSIQSGLEQALQSLHAADPFLLFPSKFTSGTETLPINGLIWMGDRQFMLGQIREKLEHGFRCIKLKIGSLNFETELDIIGGIRKEYTEREIELRVDANGAFSVEEAPEKLKRLAEFGLHSIEQPIRPGQWEAMAGLCSQTPLPIALDEELIGIGNVTERHRLLQMVQPQFLILKPSLLGGLSSCRNWIDMAEQAGVGWWVTSALESNIGLNAIAQWTYTLGVQMPQGLGTGGLFTNNFTCPLRVGGGCLSYNPEVAWNGKIRNELCI